MTATGPRPASLCSARRWQDTFRNMPRVRLLYLLAAVAVIVAVGVHEVLTDVDGGGGGDVARSDVIDAAAEAAKTPTRWTLNDAPVHVADVQPPTPSPDAAEVDGALPL